MPELFISYKVVEKNRRECSAPFKEDDKIKMRTAALLLLYADATLVSEKARAQTASAIHFKYHI